MAPISNPYRTEGKITGQHCMPYRCRDYHPYALGHVPILRARLRDTDPVCHYIDSSLYGPMRRHKRARRPLRPDTAVKEFRRKIVLSRTRRLLHRLCR